MRTNSIRRSLLECTAMEPSFHDAINEWLNQCWSQQIATNTNGVSGYSAQWDAHLGVWPISTAPSEVQLRTGHARDCTGSARILHQLKSETHWPVTYPAPVFPAASLPWPETITQLISGLLSTLDSLAKCDLNPCPNQTGQTGHMI